MKNRRFYYYSWLFLTTNVIGALTLFFSIRICGYVSDIYPALILSVASAAILLQIPGNLFYAALGYILYYVISFLDHLQKDKLNQNIIPIAFFIFCLSYIILSPLISGFVYAKLANGKVKI
jgi:hypothetical protein